MVGHLHKKSTRSKLVNAFQIRSRRSKLGPLTGTQRGNQRSSEVIRGHQRSSEALSVAIDDVPAHLSRPTAISRNQSQSVAISRHQSPSTHRPIHLIRPLICWQVGTAMHAFARDQPPIGIDIARRAASHLWGRVGGAVLSTCMRHRQCAPRRVPPPTWHSVAISRNQPSSAVISRPTSHVAFGGKLKHCAASGDRQSIICVICASVRSTYL